MLQGVNKQKCPSCQDRIHTFFAILLYSSTKSFRSLISSVSDSPPRSPLVEVHVALLWTPLEVFLAGKDKRVKDDDAEGLGRRSGVWSSRDVLMSVVIRGKRGAQWQ